MDNSKRLLFSATDKEMQVAPHQPQEAVCVDKRGFRECLGSAGGERADHEHALHIAEATRTSFHIRLVLWRLRPMARVATGARHG